MVQFPHREHKGFIKWGIVLLETADDQQDL